MLRATVNAMKLPIRTSKDIYKEENCNLAKGKLKSLYKEPRKKEIVTYCMQDKTNLVAIKIKNLDLYIQES